MSPRVDYMQRAGWTSEWDSDDREQVQEHHRELYRKLKREHGGRMASPDQIPGLLEGVESLLEYGYSLTDIGAMIGVSRERVRQWVEEYDLNRPYHNGAQYRVWDEDSDQFVPVSREDMYEQARLSYLEQKSAERAHEMALRWNETVTAARDIASETCRSPTLTAVARRVLGRPGDVGEKVIPTLLIWLNGGNPSQGNGGADTYAEVTAKLFDLAGLPHPTAGWAGRREARPSVEMGDEA